MQDHESTFVLLVISGLFVSSVMFSYLLNGLLLRFSKTLGIRNRDETIIRWSSTSKPALGGIGMYIVFLISLGSYSLFFQDTPILWNKELLGLIIATGIAFLMGLSDDAYNTRPLFKLFIQISCALLLIATGTYITLFNIPAVDYALTVLWVVGIMNSINMLDNMDAITTSVSGFIVLEAMLLMSMEGKFMTTQFFVLTGVLGSLIGFLFYNWNPSKMYMGDTGSQFLGILLAAISITYFWNDAQAGTEIGWRQVPIVMLAFIIPIVDTTTVTINRLRRGQSPFVGGKDHTTHHLSYMGLSDRQVALVFIGISTIAMALIGWVKTSAEWTSLQMTLTLGYCLVIFVTLYGITHVKKAKQQFEKHHNGPIKQKETEKTSV